MSNQKSTALHFVSGLPRSGSTLLAALLLQNPRFHANITSPLGNMYRAMLRAMSDETEYGVFLTDVRRQSVLNGIFENYYRDVAASVIFDNNRAWCGNLPALSRLFPQSKMIACVRDIAWIIDSFESLARKNAFRPSALYNFETGTTVYTRATALAASGGTVGFAYDGLKEAFYGEYADRLLLMQYETLTQEPGKAMRAIYDFIGEPYFRHDFDNIEFDAFAFDERIGVPGLHAVGRSVRVNERPSILPPDLFRRFENDAFWRSAADNPQGVRII